MTPIAALVPLSASVTAMSGLVFSQSITETGSGSTETLFTGSVLAAAVGVLGYLVRQFAAGKLVARDPADVETKLIELAERAMAIAEEAHTREGDWRAAAAVNRQRPFDPEAR